MKALAPPDCNPYRPGFLVDPWEDYRRMRNSGPVLWHETLKLWFICGHAEAVSVLRDDSFLVYAPGHAIQRLADRAGTDLSRLVKVLDALPLFRNPPAHALSRRSAAAAFGGRPIATYASDMDRIAGGLVAQALRNGGFDAARDYADRMPAYFMAQLLGIPAADVPALQESAVVLKAMNRLISLGDYRRLDRAAAAPVEYFSCVAAERRRSPGDDGISRMIAAEYQGERLADDQVAPLCLALFLVGIETTATLIGTAIRALTGSAALADELRAEPALLKPAIDEFLRFESPVQNVRRQAGVSRTLAGQQIEPGEEVVVLLAAANRDETAWQDSERLDFRRAAKPHLAFADGSHVCIGAALARMEAHAALGALLRAPAWQRAAGDDLWWDFDWLRRLRAFPVEFR